MTDRLEDLKTRFAPLADPARAAGMRAHQLEQFEFLGIPAPLRRAAVKTRRKPWRETVDGVAGVIGKLVRAHRTQQIMDAALSDASFWIRRIAMTHQLGWRLETDEARLFGYALQLAPEREFFIRKAIGWALRDHAKWGPQAVSRFVAAHEYAFSTLTVREATKHLRAAPPAPPGSNTGTTAPRTGRS